MRIVEQKSTGSVAGPRGARAAPASGGARFSVDTGATSPRAEAHAPVAILGALDALIAIQEDETTKDRRRRRAKRGQGMLDVLDELKIALLSGRLPPDIQARISAALRDSGASGDPRLDSIVDAIELRAEVELAKLKRAVRGPGGA